MSRATTFRNIERRAGKAAQKLEAEFGRKIPQAYRYFMAYLTGLKVDLDAEWRQWWKKSCMMNNNRTRPKGPRAIGGCG